jgi:predicted esterase
VRTSTDDDDPHAGQPVLAAGPAPADARLTVILVHGRGAPAEDILSLGAELRLDDVALLAPQAANSTWYPYSFLAPISQNEPHLSSSLRVLSRLMAECEGNGVGPERIALLGFSQGACLSLEYAARHAQRYAGVFGLSGGLIGPPGTPRGYEGSLHGTPVLLGCSDVDPHIPLTRVHESADVFRRLGGSVDERIYKRMGHTVNGDEIAAIQTSLGAVRR